MREAFFRYTALAPVRRNQFIFRGHADSNWSLTPTLDRIAPANFADAATREAFLESVVEAFRKEAREFVRSPYLPQTDFEWECLGRHHGLATSLLDWTDSPFVAAFFAFHESNRKAEKASIWVLDRENFNGAEVPEIQLFPQEDLLTSNERATEQRSIFMKIRNTTQTAESILGDALTRFDIPTAEQSVALTDLDEMLINARSMFRSLDGVAQCVNSRMFII